MRRTKLEFDIGRVDFGAYVASEPWWIDAEGPDVLGPSRIHLLLGATLRKYERMTVFSIYLVLAKLSVAVFKDQP